ncbi:IclR family transcriptional regulator [Aquimarina sp. 2201CG5-10]|uniref:IclR family transcriptional regulator n=1 Tax=Aquimarina callyspongiae TaxID=3098150 RepID=UPI002AB5AF6B|nr:IclR family transcriptional regulator [Aquimarina sp. 2201CG5-10]MDY8138611.1 IclR family transcriptional regulator [Aquimarina sp. 2201CG5-10]
MNNITDKKILNTSVEKAFKILDCFSMDKLELGVTEIAKQMGTNKSAVYRMLATMEALNVIQQNPENGKYRLGLKLFELSQKVSIHKNFISKARPFMEELVKRAGETAHLAIYKNQKVYFLDKVVGRHDLQINSQIGSEKPLHCTGLGKIMLAFAEHNYQNIIHNLELETVTKNTITDRRKLITEIETIKNKGFALDLEENEIGLVCVAVPVFSTTGKFIAAISTSGPSARFNENEIQTYTGDLKQTAEQLKNIFS